MTSSAEKLVDSMSKAVAIPECTKDIGGMKDDISLSPSEKRDGAMGLFSRLLRLESLKRRSSTPESPTSTEPPATYYGVYIPCEIKKGPDEEALHVYKNKSDALELVRRYKQSRFKAFNNRQEAIAFALRGAEPPESHEGTDSSLMGEKPYPFKAPSSQELVALRRAIEAGQTAVVRDRVWDNPRFLVSSGNTPSILQEGCRYNALHAASKAKNAEICNLILTTVGNPAFVQTLYGSDSDPDACKEFAEILLDRYLNTPDKARHETPLHFAATYGADEVVDVLTAFPQCNVHAVNKFGKQAKDVICERSSTSSPSVRARILSLLSPRYYVPVLHAEDGSAAPAVGPLFTPNRPPDINQDPLSPRYEIRAFAGPMDATRAASFRRCWKTPPRRPALTSATAAFRLKDPVKGLERVGRSLAEEMKVDWKEYWPFLDTFTDLKTTEGLTLLENYLKAKYDDACSLAYSDSCIAYHYPEEISNLSISRLTLGNITHSPTKDTSMSPMTELCVAMNTCKITHDNRPVRKINPIRQRQIIKAREKLENGEPPVINHTVSQLLCIERTCQVFAKRINDALTFSLNAEPEVAGESLKAEAKHLQHTMYTYMDDERFKDIDFALIHSRLAQLVVHKLKQDTKEINDLHDLVKFLSKLRCPNDDVFSSDDERKPVNCRGLNKVKYSHVIDGHVRCVARFICEELTEQDKTRGAAISESECTEIWGKLWSKCRCDWKVETFERNSKKNTSFRKNRSLLSGCSKNDFVRRLTFDHDIGDGAGLPPTIHPLEPTRSSNSPGGDGGDPKYGDQMDQGGPQPALYTLDVDKCRVVTVEISEDESELSDDGSAYLTATDESADQSDDEMADASDRAIAEPFIYGEEPTKMDRLVYDALSECSINCEQYPNVYKWRHSVALYSAAERDKWREQPSSDVSVCQSPRPAARSTPHKEPRCLTPVTSSRGVPLQISNWLHVTGPNSPRSALEGKNIGHNVSFGF